MDSVTGSFRHFITSWAWLSTGRQGSKVMLVSASSIGVDLGTLDHVFRPTVPVHFSIDCTSAKILGNRRCCPGVDVRYEHSQKIGAEPHRFLIERGGIRDSGIDQSAELAYDCSSIDGAIDPKQRATCAGNPVQNSIGDRYRSCALGQEA